MDDRKRCFSRKHTARAGKGAVVCWVGFWPFQRDGLSPPNVLLGASSLLEVTTELMSLCPLALQTDRLVWNGISLGFTFCTEGTFYYILLFSWEGAVRKNTSTPAHRNVLKCSIPLSSKSGRASDQDISPHQSNRTRELDWRPRCYCHSAIHLHLSLPISPSLSVLPR